MLLVPGTMALLSVPVALFFQEYYGVEALLLTTAVCLPFGGLARRRRPFRRSSFSPIEIMGVATLGWLLVSLVGALPFFYLAHRLPPEQVAVHQVGPFGNFLNAAFEAVSGYTSTGLTVTPSESSLPRTLQWWRSFLQWVGGIGIIVFISALHPGIASVSAHYSDQDGKKDEEEKQQDEQEENDEEEEVLPNAEVSWSKIWWIYLLFSLLAVGLLWLQDIPLWEAINHGMSAISTGGFSVTDDSLEGYSVVARWTVTFIIIIGSLNFHLFHQLFTQRAWRKFISNQQHQLFFALIVLVPLLLYYENNRWGHLSSSWTDLVFQLTSALGTCGFYTVTLSEWSLPTLLILSLMMLIGGATASTTGGVKLFRVLLLVQGNFHGLLTWTARTDRPLKLRFNHHVFSPEKSLRLYRSMGVFFFFWIVLYMFTVVVLIHEVSADYSLNEILFEAASAVGTVGLSVGITGHELAPLPKVSLMMAMLVGRLELMPLVIILTSLARKR